MRSRGKAAALKAHISNTNADIIIANESEITPEIVDGDFLPSNYTAIRDDKCPTKHGVFVAFRNSLIVTHILLHRLYIGSFYCHTNSDPSSLHSLFENVTHLTRGAKFPNLIIAGDFNLPDVNWDEQTVNMSPQYGNEVNQIGIDTMNDLFLTQMVSEPTCGKNILDLLFSSCPDQVQNIQVRPGISDHSCVTTEVLLKAKVTKKKPRKIFMYGKADPGELKRHIADLRDNFKATAKNRNASDNWKYFTDELAKIVQKLVPQKIIRERHDLPWLRKQLCKKIKTKNRLHRKAKKAKPSNKQQRWDAYHNQQRTVQQEIKKAYEEYMNSLFEEDTGHPAKLFFKTLKAKRRDQVGAPPLRLKKNGKLETTARGKAKVLNAQHTSVFKEEDTSTIPSLGASPYPGMTRITVTCAGVAKLLSSLNPKKAIGPDQVPTFLLKDYAKELAPILQVIFQQSLDTGMVPADWKRANVAAIYKKGDKNLASNYRPVSLTSVSCKVLEHIVFRAIMDHVDLHKILKNFQHGFRAQHKLWDATYNHYWGFDKGP